MSRAWKCSLSVVVFMLFFKVFIIIIYFFRKFQVQTSKQVFVTMLSPVLGLYCKQSPLNCPYGHPI